jgi:DNA-binding NtrC family response regulator
VALRALVVDDDRYSLDMCSMLVEEHGFEVTTAASLGEARRQLAATRPNLVMLDLRLPDGDGLELVETLKEPPGAHVILMTGHASVDSAVQALRKGATDYLVKPLDIPRVREVLAEVVRVHALQDETATLAAEARAKGRFGPLIGSAPAMQRVYDLIARVAPTEATVLVTGESGTGKELVATAVHQLSRRAERPFVAINCGAISPSLIESELFGHERGSFTGADRSHRGVFERASGGSLLLDEISEMPLELQVRLLRVLETGSVVRVGGDRPIAVDVRVIAATNRDPADAVAAGRLREDLLYRLQVFPISLPPLRDRADDVPALVDFFLSELNRIEGLEKRVSQQALARLCAHSWPGNVRELRNVVHRAFIMGDHEIGEEALPVELGGTEPGPANGLSFAPGTPLAEMERRAIFAALDHYGLDKRRTAEALGISLKTLYNRLHEYGRLPKSRPPGET